MLELQRRVMRNPNVIADIHQQRGSKGLPLERVFRHLYNPDLFLLGYGKIYRNFGAMTRGVTKETVDGMCLQKIHSIIQSLKMGYRWMPVRRTDIPKANGKTRPLGIPTWSDKLVQEAMRFLLEPYYEQRFSDRSHGFRPNRGCHSALREIRNKWKGTTWFIEGDIKGCFDNIDHETLLSIIRRNVHDEQLIALIRGLLEAGYMKDWQRYDTTSGTPQGGIISPLLANIYLNELDSFVEGTLQPTYWRGNSRRWNPEYSRVVYLLTLARKAGDVTEIKRLRAEYRKHMKGNPTDPDYRRLRYVRYADDFLLGFVGPKSEAEEIRRLLGEFLEQKLKLTLSPEKTLITHAHDGRATFLGHEISVMRQGDLISKDGRRATNGVIMLRTPRKVVLKYTREYSRNGKVTHRTELLDDSDYTIIQRYQAVLRGLYEFYCMTVNVSKRLNRIKYILETSMLKTLASKHRCRVSKMRRKYRVPNSNPVEYRLVIERPGKEPLVATFGGLSLKRIPEGKGIVDFDTRTAWHKPGGPRNELILRLLIDKCELCGACGPLQGHHIRQLADIDRPGRRPTLPWEKIMAARKRKTLMVCVPCHDDIHAGRYDGPKLQGSELESRMR